MGGYRRLKPKERQRQAPTAQASVDSLDPGSGSRPKNAGLAELVMPQATSTGSAAALRTAALQSRYLTGAVPCGSTQDTPPDHDPELRRVMHKNNAYASLS
jgi:hypothetical protein